MATLHDPRSIAELLHGWLAARVAGDALAWIEDKQQKIAGGAPEWVFYTSFSSVPRYVGKADLNLAEDALAAAGRARDGWQPVHWSVDQAGRTLLVLSLPFENPAAYRHRLDQVFTTADIGESIALYQSLPLLPFPEMHVRRAAEGVRSNMAPVFNAVALRNPYPAEYFEENAWNQMVLKAIFVGSPLYLIEGIDRRANATLARMLVDFAHERWAASRLVPPELWRVVAPFGDETVAEEVERRLLNHEDPLQRRAAALFLAESKIPGAADRLRTSAAWDERIETGALTWDVLGREVHAAAGA